MIAFMFPGQGSQARGMGGGLFGQISEFTNIEKEVDALLGYSVRELCLDDPSNLLKQTQYTQPCLYVVNALYYYKAIREGARPDLLAGHSVGEINALFAAGVIDFMTGLRLVKKRGELMGQVQGGAMVAVIGIPHTAVAETLRREGLTAVSIANFNSPGQTVISGSESDLARATSLFEETGAATCVPLQVSAAFHSPYVESAARAYADFLAPMRFRAPEITVISNVTGKPYPLEDASEAVKSLLVEQITHPVYWMQSIWYLMSCGVTQFKEIGPGNVLTRLIRQIR